MMMLGTKARAERAWATANMSGVQPQLLPEELSAVS